MRHILFVDDDPRVLEGLREMLRNQRHQWEMAFAPSGEVALALLEALPFDVIVSDMQMPGMDGPTLLARVRERFPELVRIVLSVPAELEAALRAVPVAHQFLTKPCDAAMLRVAVERACRLQVLLGDASIRRTVGAMGDLPALPRFYQALTKELADPDVSLKAVAKIVEKDVAISAKVLQLVNSAFFGIAQPITTIRSAVSYLGIQALKSLVLSVEVFQVFKPDRRLAGFSLEGLHRHAQFTALVASQLPVPRHSAEGTVIAALLHDVGKLVLVSKLPERVTAVAAAVQKDRRSFFEVEEELFGSTHAEIGAYLLGLWGLPYTILEAVAHHHRPLQIPHDRFDAVAAVYVANLLAHEHSSDTSLPATRQDIDKEYLQTLNMAAHLPEWHARAAELALKSQPV